MGKLMFDMKLEHEVPALTARCSIRKLLEINRRTGIETRAAVSTYEHGFASEKVPPSISEIDDFFLEVGVDLAVRACRKAMEEANMRPEDITHTVAVTCTSQSNPGYDKLVSQQLGLEPSVDHTLLHGVGCAGGLAIMRTAAQMTLAATARGQPAVVLCFAVELCTPNARSELAIAETTAAADVCVAGAMFSDGAAAFVLSNDIGRQQSKPLFQLVSFGTEVLPGTAEHLQYRVDGHGESNCRSSPLRNRI
jgi:type III polyketide synthase